MDSEKHELGGLTPISAKAGELCPGIVSGIIGCSERYARILFWRKIRQQRRWRRD